MSLPSSSKPAQLSIRSFFSAKTPKYAPPPSQSTSKPPAPPPLPPPEPQAEPEPEPRAEPEPEPQHEDAPPSSIPPLPASLPHESSIRPITPRDLNALRRINALLLPVAYPDIFYQRAITGPYSRVITWAHDGAEPKVVGGVVCRLEPGGNVDPTTPQTLYIQSLCLLSPYRGLGLVNAAVENIIATAMAEPALNVRTVTAHVWTENEEGLKWYEGRGFKCRDRPIRGYYMKLRPDSAWLVSRDTGASVLNSLPSSAAPTTRPIPPSTTTAVVNLPPMSGPPKATRPPPSRTQSGQSYQNQRAETEWNDLPEDMSPGLLAPPKKSGSEPASGASSRSSSTARKKRDRSYPAAAFGKPPQ
ncbi:Fc.00g042640.m01.CDS01 [Cosmosporella sp. VM-42]